MIASLVFVLGVVFGSFYNVVIYRVPLELSVMKGRSMCPNCKHTLTAIELIPILSIIAQRFKCRNCRQPISPRYLIVELLTGLAWLMSYQVFHEQGLWMVASGCLLVSMCIIVAYIDYDTQLISDAVLLVFFLARLAVIYMTGESYVTMLWSILVGALSYGLIYLGALAYYRREAFGMGDIFYLATIGAWFQPLDTAIIALGSFFVAGLILLVLGIFKRFKRQQEIPFGPAISIMAIIMYHWGDIIKEVYTKWMF